MTQTPQEDAPAQLQSDGADSAPTRTAWMLSIGGLIPFILLSALIGYGGTETIGFSTVVLALAAYSATILAFLGGIRWGVSLGPHLHPRRELILSVLPSLAGWILVLIPAPYVFAGFALSFALQGVWDVSSARRGTLPLWFGKLRLVLTIVVVLCHAVGFLRTL